MLPPFTRSFPSTQFFAISSQIDWALIKKRKSEPGCQPIFSLFAVWDFGSPKAPQGLSKRFVFIRPFNYREIHKRGWTFSGD